MILIQHSSRANIKPQEPAMPKTLKQSEAESEMSEIRCFLEFVCKSIEDCKEQSKSTDKRITELLTIIKSKDGCILRLEEQMKEFEKNSKKKSVIITGLNLHSYATTATTKPKPGTCSTASTIAEEPISESATIHSNFVNFAKQKLHVTLEPYDIMTFNDLPL